MSNVTDIEEVKPHLTIIGLERTHVIPLSVIKDMSTGRLKITDVDDVNDFLPTLLLDLVENVWAKK